MATHLFLLPMMAAPKGVAADGDRATVRRRAEHGNPTQDAVQRDAADLDLQAARRAPTLDRDCAEEAGALFVRVDPARKWRPVGAPRASPGANAILSW